MPQGKLYIRTDAYTGWPSSAIGWWQLKTFQRYSDMTASTGAAKTTYVVQNYDGTQVVENMYTVYEWSGGYVKKSVANGYVRAGVTQVWVDAFDRYGISLDETGVSKLMTPAPNKEIVENKSDLEDGKRVVRDSSDVRKDERNFNLILNITAPNQDEFIARYARLCSEVLDKGFMDFYTPYCPHTVYRLTFLDCNQFSEFDRRVGKFTLSLNEPDPTNRGVTDKNYTQNL